MDKRTTGLYNKFRVARTDGKSALGEKHDGCDYFVLDLTHDPHAPAAIRAYADSCEADYPLLARDLRAKSPASEPRTNHEALEALVREWRRHAEMARCQPGDSGHWAGRACAYEASADALDAILKGER